jgi:hypothetical protein
VAYLIEFRSGHFDAAAEPKNPINPIFGHSLLAWLGEKLQVEGVSAPEPDYEDWGWYFDIAGFGSKYLVGAAGMTDEESTGEGPIDWIIQIHKHRRLSEKLMGKNKLSGDDPLCQLIERIVRSESSNQNVNAKLEP